MHQILYEQNNDLHCIKIMFLACGSEGGYPICNKLIPKKGLGNVRVYNYVQCKQYDFQTSQSYNTWTAILGGLPHHTLMQCSILFSTLYNVTSSLQGCATTIHASGIFSLLYMLLIVCMVCCLIDAKA